MKSFYSFAQNGKIYIWLHGVGVISTSQLNASPKKKIRTQKVVTVFKRLVPNSNDCTEMKNSYLLHKLLSSGLWGEINSFGNREQHHIWRLRATRTNPCQATQVFQKFLHGSKCTLLAFLQITEPPIKIQQDQHHKSQGNTLILAPRTRLALHRSQQQLGAEHLVSSLTCIAECLQLLSQDMKHPHPPDPSSQLTLGVLGSSLSLPVFSSWL